MEDVGRSFSVALAPDSGMVVRLSWLPTNGSGPQ
jgi:hypothetical protein